MESKKNKANDPNYIFNKTTKRYVLKDGSVGRRLAKEMSRKELTEHIHHQSINTALANRNLLASNLSDAELLDILRKVIDLKLDYALDDLPPKAPKLQRQVGEYKKSKASNKKKHKAKIATKKRFVLKAPPSQDTTDVEFDESTALDDTEAPTDIYSESDTSDISD